jgi:hypothetical protein
MKSLNELFADLIFANECSSNEKFIHRFSDPDGERSGKSGWSFGRVQWDTQNNGTALVCLSECGFTHNEIDGIVKQTVDVKPFAVRLAAHADIIERYDEAQLTECINSAVNFCNSYNIPVTDTGALLALADTVNQYGSLANGTAAGLRKLEHPVKAADVLAIKLTWAYARASKQKHDDTVRRYDNLITILKKENYHETV